LNLEKILDGEKTGDEMYSLIERLFPICRSITGNGVRETLKIIQEFIPIKIHEIPSGTPVFDWGIPKEWNIKDAYIKNSKGEKIIDFKKNNLHVLNYSTPIKKNISLDELKKHIYTLPEFPDWIPYHTSYYQENWGFCLSYNQLIQLKDDTYEILIDSTLEKGHMTYGEYYIEGKTKEEVILTCYICHPSMCNDNLSGVSLITVIGKILKDLKLNYSYRLLFVPETIGSITWLFLNKDKTNQIKHGLVATCVGDSGKSTYKRTRNGNCVIDKIVEKVLVESKSPYEIIDFFPSGSDERQFCSPGFDLPVGSLARTLYGRFAEYHTSGDNLSFVNAEFLNDTFKKYMKIIFMIENNKYYINNNPFCEPQLGKRGLYNMIGAQKNEDDLQLGIFWILNYSDGSNSLLDIAIKSNLEFSTLKKAADLLIESKLIKEKVD
jgi:aminopeptidase-like protein